MKLFENTTSRRAFLRNAILLLGAPQYINLCEVILPLEESKYITQRRVLHEYDIGRDMNVIRFDIFYLRKSDMVRDYQLFIEMKVNLGVVIDHDVCFEILNEEAEKRGLPRSFGDSPYLSPVG